MDACSTSDPLADLSKYVDKHLVVLGGYGTGGGGQWRSIWDAFRQYGDGSDPPKEQIERSRGCNYYCGDCHTLSFAQSARTAEGQHVPTAAKPEWTRLEFGSEIGPLFQRTGHTLTSLQAGGWLLLFGGRNLQRSERSGITGSSFFGSVWCTNDAWLLELHTDGRPPSLRELVTAGTPPVARSSHSASLLGATLYVLGGASETQRSGEVTLRDVHALHLPTRRWHQPPTLSNPPAVLARHSAAALEGKLWVFGGSTRTPRRPSNSGCGRVRFSGQLHTLSLSAPQRLAIASFGQVNSNSACSQVVGMRTVDTALTATDQLPLCTTWTRASAAEGAEDTPAVEWMPVETTGQRPAARAEHSTAAAAGKLFIFGGQRPTSASSGGLVVAKLMPARVSNDLYVLDPRTFTWSQLPRTPPLRREAASLAPLGNRFLLAFGGWTGLAGRQDSLGATEAVRQLPWSDALHALHLPSMQWFQLAAPGPQPTARYGHAAAVVDAAATVAANCLVSGAGMRVATAGEAAVLAITACDARRHPKWAGGETFSVTLSRADIPACACLHAAVNDNLDGTYTAQYAAKRAAWYSLHIVLLPPASQVEGAAINSSGVGHADCAMVQPVREPCCVEVLPGAAFALQVELPSAWAVLGEAFGPIVLHTIDAHGNELPRRLECPHIETRVAAPLRTVAASEIATTSTPRCETICFEQFCWQTIALPCVCAVPADVHGRALLWLRLCGGPARVTLVVTANAKTVPGSPSDHSLEAAELLVHLSGAPKRLFASASSRGAICDQIFGPLRVLAVDADGNAVGNSHFEPIVSVRGNDNSTYHDASSALSCEAQRMLWQSSMSASPVVLLWLTLRGVSGEVLIEVHDGSQCVPLGARVPIYLTGPPYFLRSRCEGREGWVAGEEGKRTLVRLVDANGLQVVGLPFTPSCCLAQREEGGSASTVGEVAHEPRRIEWQDASTNGAAQAATLCLRLSGRAGDVLVCVHDTAGYALNPLRLSVRLLPGAISPSRCVLAPAAALSEPLVCGGWREVVLCCFDSFGNAVAMGDDLIEFRVGAAPSRPWSPEGAIIYARSSACAAPSAAVPDEAAGLGGAKCETLAGGAYRLSWRLLTTGTHCFAVRCNGAHVPAARELCTVPAVQSALRLSLLGATGAAATAVDIEAGQRISLRVRPFDAFGNAIAEDGILSEGLLKLHVSATAGGKRNAIDEVWRAVPAAQGGGALLRVALGGHAGAVTLTVKANDGHLQGSLDCRLMPGKPVAAHCALEGDGLTAAVAGTVAFVRLWLCDAWGNNTRATDLPHLLSLFVAPHNVDEKLCIHDSTAPGFTADALNPAAAIPRTQRSNKGGAALTASAPPSAIRATRSSRDADGRHTLTYTAVHAGCYRLRVMLGGDHVHGSPATVIVCAAEACALRLRAPPHPLQCGELYGPIAAWPVDAHGNPAPGASFEPVVADESGGLTVEILSVAWHGVGAWGVGGIHASGDDGQRLRLALLTVRVLARCGGCELAFRDSSGGVENSGKLSLDLTPGRLASLRASCFMSYAVVNDSFGPITVTAEDGFGNALPAGDLPLWVSSRCLGKVADESDERVVGPGPLLPCRVWHCDRKPSAAGPRGSAVLYTCVPQSEPGALEISIYVEPMMSVAQPSLSASGMAPSQEAQAVNPAGLRLTLTSGLTFYSENHFVSKALAARQWAEIAVPFGASPANLVWTVRTCDIDAKKLVRGQLCNHFEPTPLTTKVGIIVCLRETSSHAHCSVAADELFPRAYDLADNEQRAAFGNDFHLSASAAVLKRFLTCSPTPSAGEENGGFEVPGTRFRRERWRRPGAPTTGTSGRVPLRLVETALGMVAHGLEQLEPERKKSGVPSGAVWPGLALLTELAALAALAEPKSVAVPPAEEVVERAARACSGRAEAAYAEVAGALRQLTRVSPQEQMVNGSGNTWVLKPSYGSKGVGVRLFNDGLPAVLAEKDCQRVVQRYIERPLLVGGYKFDLRCWALVVEWVPLTCWLYDECIVRFCSEPFVLSELDNQYGHITNRTINTRLNTPASASSLIGGANSLLSASTLGNGHLASTSKRPGSSCPGPRSASELTTAAAAERAQKPLVGALWSGSQFAEHMRHCGMGEAWAESVRPSLQRVAAATLRSGSERAMTRRNAFELYGLDLVLDETLKPWLIEVNESPNLAPHGSALKEGILSTMLSEVIELVVEPTNRAAERVGGWQRCVRNGC